MAHDAGPSDAVRGAISAEHARLLADHTSDVVLVYAADGTLQWASPSLTWVLGYDVDQVVGTRTNLVHPDDRAASLEHLAAAVDAGEANVRERLRLVTAEGGDRWVDSSIDLVRDDDGRLSSSIASLRDVTDQVRAEEERTRAQDRYRMLAEHAADVIAVLDERARITWVSPSVERVFGWSVDDLVGDIRLERVHEEDVRSLHGFLESLTDTGSGQATVRLRILDAEGRFRWIRVDASRTGAGDPAQRFVVAVHDIDEEVRERQSARTQMSLRLAALESMLDPYILLGAVRDGSGRIVDFEYLDANEAACAYNQITRDRLIGARLLDVFPHNATSGLFDLYVRTLESGEPLALDDFEYDNERLGEERRYDIRAIRVGDALSYSWRDVTDRFRAAEALAERERMLATVLDNIGDVVLRHAADGTVLWASPSMTRVFGWPVDQVIGTRFDFVAAEERDRVEAWLDLIRREPVEESEGLLVVSRPDGTRRSARARVRLVPDPHGSFEAVTVLRDVTEEVEAQRALAESEERFRLLAENSADVVFRLVPGPEPRVEWISRSVTDVLGWQPDALAGRSVAGLLHPDDVAAALPGAGPGRLVARFRTADGGYRWLSTVTTPVYDDGGEVVGWVGGARDVTAGGRGATTPRAMVVGDRYLLRQGLNGLLEKGDGLAVLPPCSVDEVADRLRSEPPDVLVLALMVGPRSAAQLRTVVDALVATAYPVGLLVVAPAGVELAGSWPTEVRAGAGLLAEDDLDDPGRLVRVVLDVATGAVSLDQDTVRRLTGPVGHPGLALLSPREREVLDRLAEGLSNQGIAESLGLTVKSVEAHVTAIFRKLGLEAHQGRDRRLAAALILREARP